MDFLTWFTFMLVLFVLVLFYWWVKAIDNRVAEIEKRTDAVQWPK